MSAPLTSRYAASSGPMRAGRGLMKYGSWAGAMPGRKGARESAPGLCPKIGNAVAGPAFTEVNWRFRFGKLSNVRRCD